MNERPPRVEPITTDAVFSATSWHDNFIYSIHFDAHQFESHLRLEIDHIVKWIQPDPRHYKFWISPARLIFHNVTDLAIRIDFERSGYQQSIHQLSINGISRQRVSDQKICLEQPYYAWTIETNWPDGEITFGATGYSQTLLAEPVLCDDQQLDPEVRQQLMSTKAD